MSRRTTVSRGDGLRLDLHLDPDLAKQLRAYSAASGCSLTDAVRSLVRGLPLTEAKPMVPAVVESHPDAGPTEEEMRRNPFKYATAS